MRLCKTLLLKMSCIRTRINNNSQTNALALSLAMKQRFETEAWSNNSENGRLNSQPPPPPPLFFLHHTLLFPFAYLAHSTLSTLCLLSISKMVTTRKKCLGLTHAKNALAFQAKHTRSSEHAVLLSHRVGACTLYGSFLFPRYGRGFTIALAPVVQASESAISRINHYSANKHKGNLLR